LVNVVAAMLWKSKRAQRWPSHLIATVSFMCDKNWNTESKVRKQIGGGPKRLPMRRGWPMPANFAVDLDRLKLWNVSFDNYCLHWGARHRSRSSDTWVNKGCSRWSFRTFWVKYLKILLI
jgi:hypothetical protein